LMKMRKVLVISILFKDFIYLGESEREQAGGGAEGEGERESQADSKLSVEF